MKKAEVKRKYYTTKEVKEHGLCSMGCQCATCMYSYPGDYMVSEDWTNEPSRCIYRKKPLAQAAENIDKFIFE